MLLCLFVLCLVTHVLGLLSKIFITLHAPTVVFVNLSCFNAEGQTNSHCFLQAISLLIKAIPHIGTNWKELPLHHPYPLHVRVELKCLMSLRNHFMSFEINLFEIYYLKFLLVLIEKIGKHQAFNNLMRNQSGIGSYQLMSPESWSLPLCTYPVVGWC